MRLIKGLFALSWFAFSTVSSADNFAYIASGVNSNQPRPTISIVNTNTGKLVTTLIAPEPVEAIAVTPNSKGTKTYIVASNQDGASYIYTLDAQLNEIVDDQTINFSLSDDLGSGIRLDTAVLSPDDRWLILAGSPTGFAAKSVYLVDMKLPNKGRRYPVFTLGDGGNAESMAVSPDGKFIAIVRSSYWGESVVPDPTNPNSKNSFVSRITLLDLERIANIIDKGNANYAADSSQDAILYLETTAGIAGDMSMTIPAPADTTLENASAGIVFSPDPDDPVHNPMRLFVANSWANSISVFTVEQTSPDAWLAANDASTFPGIQALYNEFPSIYTLAESPASPIQLENSQDTQTINAAPYGLAVSKDNKTLYVSMSRRWSMQWNTGDIQFDGYLNYLNVSNLAAAITPQRVNFYPWAPPYTSMHPRALSIMEDPNKPGEVSIAYLKQIAGSTTQDHTADGYYVSTVHAAHDLVTGAPTGYFTETSNVLVSGAAFAPVYFNGDFVGENCDTCPKGPTDSIRSRLNPPTAINPWWLLFAAGLMLAVRRFYRLKA